MAFTKTVILASLAMVGALSAVEPPQVGSPEAPSGDPRQKTVERAGAERDKREPQSKGAKTDGEAAAFPKVTTQLMFYGNAEKAMTLYTSVIPNSKVTSIKRYGKGQAGAEGTVMHATFTLNGRETMCIDSPAVHDFTFTPATSLFVTCKDEAQVKEFFEKLSKDGKVFMPLQAYPFAKKFAWFTDRFGVSWQLSCPKD